MTGAEQMRLAENAEGLSIWHRWGPYLSERQWGTVREDYSPGGSAWDYFPHDQARMRAYRWGEDGLGGICDRHGLLCFAVALWNGNDPILKERLFGLTNSEGNHGEDVKEVYFYLDNTPTHSYMKYLYKYPQREFPYRQLVEENRRRDKDDMEYEVFHTHAFEDNRYFDVLVEYAKAAPEDIAIRIEIINRGPEPASLTVLPTLWFRNTWAWGYDGPKPHIEKAGEDELKATHERYGNRWLFCEGPHELLFTENETNRERLGWGANDAPYVKDAFHDYIIHGQAQAVNPALRGTKAAAVYRFTLEPGESKIVPLRFTDYYDAHLFGDSFENLFTVRRAEADEFYKEISPDLPEDLRRIQRQAFAGMLWNKQFYHYDMRTWLSGDPNSPAPPESRLTGRNSHWKHFYAAEILSMPDKWEYPWFAAWDSAFHCIPLALVDPHFAKEQLILLLREWYMHPNGQMPAYEWAFHDVNPPVHAWSAMRVFQIDRRITGKADIAFLERVFHKLLLNFTWWVNRKDEFDNNVFEGGFLGLDNIGVFDRNMPLHGYTLEQSDGTSWMAMYCLNMLAIALELAQVDHAYEDVASKFFEHFIFIADAMNHLGGDGTRLWDDEDGFYYDVLHDSDGTQFPLKVRSMVGLIPLFAVMTLEEHWLEQFPGFTRRMRWFIENRPDLVEDIACVQTPGRESRRLLAIVSRDRLRRILTRMLDETEFLSPYGLRSLSRYHAEHPYSIYLNGMEHSVSYAPAESPTRLFGGNSNWRGPVWFPVNYLLIESLQKFDYYFGNDFRVECPVGSGHMLTLWEVAQELSRRLIGLFARNEQGYRPIYGGTMKFQTDPHFRDYLFFHEYFHGDNGAGLGASQQTGWTGLVAKLIDQSGK
jgi:hypothetical protein